MADSKKCKICGEAANDFINQLSLIHVCDTHNRYHDCYNYEVIQKRLGLIKDYSDSLKKCVVCEKELSSEELNSISEYQPQIVCDNHSDVKFWWQADMAKLWYEYKQQLDKLDTTVDYRDENVRREFNIWIQSKIINNKIKNI